MANSKISDLKNILDEMTLDELKQEILKLYNILPQVKDFYNQDLMTEEERQVILNKFKEKIYVELWTSKGNPKGMVNNSTIKKILSEYELICLFQYDLVDLLIYRVEITTEYAEQQGGMAESNYNTSITTFKKAMKIMRNNNFLTHFEKRIKILLKATNLDFWYVEQLEHLFYENSQE
jgi:hypothetical protein